MNRFILSIARRRIAVVVARKSRLAFRPARAGRRRRFGRVFVVAAWESGTPSVAWGIAGRRGKAGVVNGRDPLSQVLRGASNRQDGGRRNRTRRPGKLHRQPHQELRQGRLAGTFCRLLSRLFDFVVFCSTFCSTACRSRLRTVFSAAVRGPGLARPPAPRVRHRRPTDTAFSYWFCCLSGSGKERALRGLRRRRGRGCLDLIVVSMSEAVRRQLLLRLASRSWRRTGSSRWGWGSHATPWKRREP